MKRLMIILLILTQAILTYGDYVKITDIKGMVAEYNTCTNTSTCYEDSVPTPIVLRNGKMVSGEGAFPLQALPLKWSYTVKVLDEAWMITIVPEASSAYISIHRYVGQYARSYMLSGKVEIIEE
jgi:hypothetical protein